MRILRAEHLGMCFGVRDAIRLAVSEAGKRRLTILGELVHNRSVVEDLKRRGIRMEHDPARVATDAVMITAHGASEAAVERLRQGGKNVLEATCPLVDFAHRALQSLVRQGYHPVIIGKAGHVEVRGMTGDLDAFDIVLSDADVEQLAPRERFGVVAQTTQPIDKVRHLVERIRRRFPGATVRFHDTVCQPTKQRQDAAAALARRCDVVIVVGGANSNNTRELAETCRRHCSRVFHVQSAGDLRAEWLADAGTVGLTAGTSTPDKSIEEVEQWMLERIAATGTT